MTTPAQSIESRLDTPLKRWIPVNLETLLVLLILILAVVSRFYDLGARAISHDEVNHVIPAFDFYSGRGYAYAPLSHGPLQFHMMALSYALFGDNDFTSRIPAALFSVATIAVALLTLRRYLGRAGALAAGVMLLISPYMLFYGRYERNEAFIVLWGLLTIYAILRYLEKGERRVLYLFTLVNALHFTDKATAYIFAAAELIFLAAYFVDRLSRREWSQLRARSAFLIALVVAVVLLAAAAGFYLTQKPAALPAQPATPPVQSAAVSQPSMSLTMLIVLGVLGVAGLSALALAAVMVVRGLGWAAVRSERTFDLLMLLGTLVIPLLAAFPLKLAGIDPQDYSSAGILRSGTAIVLLGLIAIGLGWWWQGRQWLRYAALFYIPFILLYTTFFTNPTGLLGGFVGALSYWSGQERGSQPLYYFALLQIPVYEFLPALGTLTAAGIAVFKHLWQSQPGEPFRSSQSSAGEVQPVPTVALTIYWSASCLIAFSVAGEKMPWLTIHIALPMILAAAWAVGWLVETVDWGKVRDWGGRHYTRAALLAIFGLLAILTARAAYRAAYINYDYPFEYLVYAHSAPDPKELAGEIEELSRRTTGSLDMVVAYDNNVRYSFWWYMRHYPNRIDFDVNPTLDLRRAPVIVVSSENYAKIGPVVRNDYNVSDAMRLWWPSDDYWNLKWEAIAAERSAVLGPKAPPMNLLEYLKYAWPHIRPFFTDARVRSAVWQIWFNRDFTQWAALRNSQNYTLTNWGVSNVMRFYVRKDVANLIWTYGAAAQTVVQPVDPYVALTLPFTPDLVLGGLGNQPGQFQAPRALAVAPDGSLYVVDSFNHRIQHLSPSGAVLQVWGSFADISKGDAPGGTFNEPWGLAIGPDGSVYIADTWNHRIQKFSPDGKFLGMWGHGPTDAQDGFYGPRGIVVDAQGHVYVADTGNKRIMLFDSNGKFLAQIGSPGSDLGQLDEPVGLALGVDGKLYVSDTWNQRVQVFAPDASGLNFTPLAQWPVAGWSGQSVDNKPFLAVDGQGDTFVTDPEACRVIEFTPGGQALHVWGGCGTAGSFSLPDGLAVDGSGGLWVSDARTGTLIHYRTAGTNP